MELVTAPFEDGIKRDGGSDPSGLRGILKLSKMHFGGSAKFQISFRVFSFFAAS